MLYIVSRNLTRYALIRDPAKMEMNDMQKDSVLELIIKIIFIAILAFVFTKTVPAVLIGVFNYIENIAIQM